MISVTFLGCAEAALDEVNGILWLFGFFVESDKHFGQLINDSRLLEEFSEFFFLLLGGLNAHTFFIIIIQLIINNIQTMIGGRLKLKNSKHPLLGKRPKREDEATVKSTVKPKQEEAKDEVYLEQPITIGTGKLITSGKTVHGFETNFPDQLSLGDFIILMELEGDRLVEKERRKVNMVLSARSCGIEEAFSEDLIDKSEYYVQRKPKLRERVKPVEEILKERIAAEK